MNPELLVVRSSCAYSSLTPLIGLAACPVLSGSCHPVSPPSWNALLIQLVDGASLQGHMGGCSGSSLEVAPLPFAHIPLAGTQS